jgi:hypothetical protein
MVGHLEELWPTTAVFVVALIVPIAFYTLVPSKQGHRSRLGRRYLRSPPEKEPLGKYNAYVVLVLCVIASVIGATVPKDDFHRAYVIYGSLFFFGIVVPSVFVLVAHRDVGFTSLFGTIDHMRKSKSWIADAVTVALCAGLGILVVHLAFYPWPDITKESVSYAGLTAAQARDQATQKVDNLRRGTGLPPLVYSTQARGIAKGKDAWLVYFTLHGADSGCVVTVGTEPIQYTSECAA